MMLLDKLETVEKMEKYSSANRQPHGIVKGEGGTLKWSEEEMLPSDDKYQSVVDIYHACATLENNWNINCVIQW